MSTNLNAPDATMSVSGRNAASTGLFVAYSALALIVVPFLLIKLEATVLGTVLPFLMAGGLTFAGLWGTVATFLVNPKTGEPVPGRGAKAGLMFLLTAVLSVVAWFAASAVIGIGNDSWDSYDTLKSGGITTYILLGLLPVVTYFVLLQAMSSRRIMTNIGWPIVSIICLALSMLAPWFWAGFKLYADYHVM